MILDENDVECLPILIDIQNIEGWSRSICALHPHADLVRVIVVNTLQHADSAHSLFHGSRWRNESTEFVESSDVTVNQAIIVDELFSLVMVRAKWKSLMLFHNKTALHWARKSLLLVKAILRRLLFVDRIVVRSLSLADGSLEKWLLNSCADDLHHRWEENRVRTHPLSFVVWWAFDRSTRLKHYFAFVFVRIVRTTISTSICRMRLSIEKKNGGTENWGLDRRSRDCMPGRTHTHTQARI